uniref:NADH-ubiquinone oxidoreductase chain 2 n=1 Tax=Sunius melanocephalus TaxID=1588492 RepID=A0A0S2M900_9COLE|nr:NADH deshydrogenase subunit 2 [Sunius melanocephalus]
MEGLSWLNCLILLTWQKIAPMILLMYSMSYPLFLYMIIIASMLISSIMGLNQISLRKILAYSSINHIGWMISSMFFMNSIWMYYFIIYSIISMNLIWIFLMFNIFNIKQLILHYSTNFIVMMSFVLNMMSLGGLPPFLGFFPKWLTIQNLMYKTHFFLSFSMMMLTLITLFYYMRISYSSLTLTSNKTNYTLKINNSKFWLNFNNSISILGLILSTSIFNYL